MDGSPRLYKVWCSAAAVAIGTLLNAGCASNRIQAQWVDPAFSDRPLQGAKVLVACTAEETAVQRICQDEVAARLAAAGAQPVIASDRDRPGVVAGKVDDRALEAARRVGAKAVFASAVGRDSSIAGPSTTIGIGVGSSSGGWGSGTRTGGGVGMSVPVGGNRLESVYGANMVLTDVESGRVMWTIKVVAPSSHAASAQISDLAKTAVDEAQRAGLF